MEAVSNLLPTPQSVARGGPDVELTAGSRIQIVTGRRPHPKVDLAARIIRDHLESQVTTVPVRVSIATEQTPAAGQILLFDFARQSSPPISLDAADRQAIDTFEQGYVLKALDGRRLGICGHPQGILWGAMTLLQLLEPGESDLRIPGVHIRDFPHFEYRCAADWLTNAEANRHSMDLGRGWTGFEEMCRRKIDLCLRYKINAVLFDGFGWGLEQRPPEYATVIRRITQYARQRGIHLSFGGYGAGYGMTFQKGPLYEDAQYLGQVFHNRQTYPDGPIYPCTGETRQRAIRKGIDTRILGTCRSNDALNRLKAKELQEFVRAVEPGMLYIHHEDYGSCRTTEAAWRLRCDRCRRRWPNDDASAPDGAAGAIAEGYGWLIRAVNEVRNPDTGYEAARDCRILLVSPVYCLSDHTPEAWDAMRRFWQSAGRQLPAASNVMVCFRETFPLDSQPVLWSESFNAAMREAGLDLGCIVFFITGGDHFLNDYPFVGGAALTHLFLGAQGMLFANGHAYQEPLQLLNAEYCWNVNGTGYAPRPASWQQTWNLWIGLSENESAPEPLHGPAGFLRRACASLYGESVADIMTRYFSTFVRLQNDQIDRPSTAGQQDVAPQRRSYLPMSFDRIYAPPVLWRALALDSRTWGDEIDSERMVSEMERLKIDRPELHRRLSRRWMLAGQVLEQGVHLLNEALSRGPSAAVRADLQFLLDATRIKRPLAQALELFHEALQILLGPPTGRKSAQSLLNDALPLVAKASSLAGHHYPAVVDPVGEAGATRTYLRRLDTAIRRRLVPAEADA